MIRHWRLRLTLWFALRVIRFGAWRRNLAAIRAASDGDILLVFLAQTWRRHGDSSLVELLRRRTSVDPELLAPLLP